MARFETVGHQWADLSDQGYGVSLMNDCKYGYDIKHNQIRLSLIKSATHPDPEADQGKHQFTYALFPHLGGWLYGDTVRYAWELNSPLKAASGTAEQHSFSMFSLNPNTAMISAVKKSEDRGTVIVRLHDYSGSRQQLTLNSSFTISGWRECSLMEKPEGKMQTGNISFVLEPYEIKTFEIELVK